MSQISAETTRFYARVGVNSNQSLRLEYKMPSKSPYKPTMAVVRRYERVPQSVGKDFNQHDTKRKAMAKALRKPASMDGKDQVSKDIGC